MHIFFAYQREEKAIAEKVSILFPYFSLGKLSTSEFISLFF